MRPAVSCGFTLSTARTVIAMLRPDSVMYLRVSPT
ncbi:hypothetical protein MAUB1S_02692 [Mycolicibacterium aubagnense]